MARSVKPVWQMLCECVHDLPAPFTHQQVLDWFSHHYPDAREGTVSTHLASHCCVNAPSPTIHAVVYRRARGQYIPVEKAPNAPPTDCPQPPGEPPCRGPLDEAWRLLEMGQPTEAFISAIRTLEHTLRSALANRDILPGRGLAGMIASAEKLGLISLAERLHLDRLRNWRNVVIHEGLRLTDEQVREELAFLEPVIVRLLPGAAR